MQATPNTEQGGVTLQLTTDEAEIIVSVLMDVASRIGDEELYRMGSAIERAVSFAK